MANLITDEELKGYADIVLQQCPIDIVNSVRPFATAGRLHWRLRSMNYRALVRINTKLKKAMQEVKRTEVAYE